MLGPSDEQRIEIETNHALSLRLVEQFGSIAAGFATLGKMQSFQVQLWIERNLEQAGVRPPQQPGSMTSFQRDCIGEEDVDRLEAELGHQLSNDEAKAVIGAMVGLIFEKTIIDLIYPIGYLRVYCGVC